MSRIKSPQTQDFVSAQHVAKLAGVSRSAVSRAFTPGASIADDTRRKVMAAAETLGYQVNDLARGLLANKSRLVGLVATKPELGFRTHLASALTKALIARGSIPLMINTGQTDVELLAAQRALFGHRAEATIILSGSPPASFVDLARRNGQPLVVIGRSERDLDRVEVDNRSAARQAAALFVERGFKRLGLAGSQSATPSVVERENAFREEALRLGAHVLAVRGGDSDYGGGRDAGRQLLDRQEKPQGIFCINDLMAFGVIDHARREAGLHVPQDLSVIGFDDLPEAGWLSYGLTTFRQDPTDMAETVIALIDLRQAEPGRPPLRAQIAAPLIVRETFVPNPSMSSDRA